MTVKEFLEKTYSEDKYYIRQRIMCNDGYSVSYQGGSQFHYCSPREHCNKYDTVELGFPSELDDIINNYAEEEDTCDTVFGYVPIDIVQELVDKHGGIVNIIS